jgi:hypothetical protein
MQRDFLRDLVQHLAGNKLPHREVLVRPHLYHRLYAIWRFERL